MSQKHQSVHIVRLEWSPMTCHNISPCAKCPLPRAAWGRDAEMFFRQFPQSGEIHLCLSPFQWIDRWIAVHLWYHQVALELLFDANSQWLPSGWFPKIAAKRLLCLFGWLSGVSSTCSTFCCGTLTLGSWGTWRIAHFLRCYRQKLRGNCGHYDLVILIETFFKPWV